MGNDGVAIIEVLIAAIVLGVATIGIALMFSHGGSFITAEGDDRVAIYLARQKIEDLRRISVTCIPIGGPGDTGALIGPNPNTGCTATQVYNELQVREAPRYIRTTAVWCVVPTDFTPSVPPNPIPTTCSSTQLGKRIRVTVTSPMVQGREITIESALTVH